MASVNGSLEEARELRSELRKSLNELLETADYQRHLLHVLSDSCKDDSFQTAEKLVMMTLKSLNNTYPSIEEVIKRLDAYIDFLTMI